MKRRTLVVGAMTMLRKIDHCFLVDDSSALTKGLLYGITAINGLDFISRRFDALLEIFGLAGRVLEACFHTYTTYSHGTAGLTGLGRNHRSSRARNTPNLYDTSVACTSPFPLVFNANILYSEIGLMSVPPQLGSEEDVFRQSLKRPVRMQAW